MTDEAGAIWDRHAVWWAENFTQGADSEYEECLLPLLRGFTHPAAGLRVLDAGCGEGQVARLLAAEGASVIGLDASGEQVRRAVLQEKPFAALSCGSKDSKDRAGEGRSGARPLYVRGDVCHVPFASATFDLAVALLVLDHVPDLVAAVNEVSRVLRPSGRFIVFLNHPLFQTPDSGWVEDHILGECYWRIGPYLVQSLSYEEVDAGVVLPFCHRPLSTYVNCAADAGFVLERMAEPAPSQGFLANSPEQPIVAAVPRLAVLLFRRLSE